MNYTNGLTYTHALRFRPKGYSKPVWDFMVTEAIRDKSWALNIIQNRPEWGKQASDMSIQMLGRFLHLSVIDLAVDKYKYFHMRAHAEQSGLIIDRPARQRWEQLVGRRIGRSKINTNVYGEQLR